MPLGHHTHAITKHKVHEFSNIKGKGKDDPVLLTKHNAMKAYWGVEV
jgi:hypothetical protein